ncbi:MAG: hypothetical protein ACD_37C00234G0002 [uncultured bacterium]|nr:MAG: hypothetical protein ACD_37C00234G0002 [uncultured bacterium]
MAGVLLEKIKDPKLTKIIGSIPTGDLSKFKEIQKQFPNYDPSFLWLLGYQGANALEVFRYIEANYQKFHQVLDSGILKSLSTLGNFDARMWEMILCDCLASIGKLEAKEKSGADFMLVTSKGEKIQVEAVTPNEADNKDLRSIKPDFSKEVDIGLSGNIEELELPILLRVFDSFRKKEGKYRKDIPLIIAINSYKTVGVISIDKYILRRILFGLGFETISLKSGEHGLQQNTHLDGFPVAVFRDSSYEHISGVIYTSQNPIGLIPDGFGWFNQGITYVSNPLAKYKVDFDPAFFRRIECDNNLYQEKEALEVFKSLAFD